MAFTNKDFLQYILYAMSMLVYVSCSPKSTKSTSEPIEASHTMLEDYYRSRIVSILQNDREFLTGHENGAIAVWSARLEIVFGPFVAGTLAQPPLPAPHNANLPTKVLDVSFAN